jgi:hypothetical protein
MQYASTERVPGCGLACLTASLVIVLPALALNMLGPMLIFEEKEWPTGHLLVNMLLAFKFEYPILYGCIYFSVLIGGLICLGIYVLRASRSKRIAPLHLIVQVLTVALLYLLAVLPLEKNFFH